MKCLWPKILLLLLVSQALAAAALWGQVGHRPFVKKYEAGIPNLSELNSVWPTVDGWWGLFTKIDSIDLGSYYWGAESVVLDTAFEITARLSHGDTSKYYFEYPVINAKSYPDGAGNFWYYLAGSANADSLRNLYYGKMNPVGQILFEREIPKVTVYDYFYEFIPLPGKNGIFLSKHSGRFANVTWLTWVDSLGNITHQDSTERIANPYHHSTIYCTIDSVRNEILAPSDDFLFSGFEVYGNRPRLSVYSPTGTLLRRKDLTNQLRDNAIGSIFPTIDGGYVAKLMEFTFDTASAAEDHRAGIVKLDSNFDVEWKKYLFPAKKQNDFNVFHQSKRGEFFLSGRLDRSSSDTSVDRHWYITKFSSDLDSLWTRFYNLGGDSIHDIQQDPIQIHTLDNGDILVLVQNYGLNLYYTTLYKLDSLGCLIGNCAIGDTTVIPPDTTHWQAPPDTLWPDPDGGLVAYPNPSAGLFSLVWNVNVGDVSTLRVCDVTGRILLTQALPRREQASTLDLRDFRAGVYLLQITTEKGRRFWTKVSILR